MIDNVTNDNMIVNKGEGYVPSPPPSPSITSTPSTTQRMGTDGAVSVDISQEVQKIGTDLAAANAKEVSASNQNVNEKELEKKLNESVNTLNEKLTRLDHDVLFKVDKRINKNYISVVEKNSKKVIREFPPEEIRSFIARFDEINQKLSRSGDVKSMIINLEV